ncbi:MAG: hypothetical protein J6W66_07110, partial [Lachnospiraceae bacterium]|nr:hypothetical protein [Lachnospiraceae bacterium]
MIPQSFGQKTKRKKGSFFKLPSSLTQTISDFNDYFAKLSLIFGIFLNFQNLFFSRRLLPNHVVTFRIADAAIISSALL